MYVQYTFYVLISDVSKKYGWATDRQRKLTLAKIGIRNARKDANNEVKKLDVSDDLKSNVEVDIQEMTDSFVKKADDLFANKEKEIMTV